MAKKQAIIKNISLNSISDVFLRIVQIVQGILVARILGPTQYGMKDALQLLQTYGTYLHLGTLNEFTRQRMHNEILNPNRAKYISDITFSFFLLISLIFVFLSIVIIVFFSFSLKVKLTILIISLLVTVTLFFYFFNVLLVSKNEFRLIAKKNILQSILVLFFVLLGAYFLGYLGYFLGALVGFFILTSYLYIISDYKPNFIIKFDEIKKLLKKGYILFILGFSLTLFFNIDRVFVFFAFGKTELGYYAIGLFFAGIMAFFKGTLILPLNPHLFQNYNNKLQIYRYVILPLRIIYVLLYFIGFILLFIIVFLVFILPKYLAGIKYIYILLFSIIFAPGLIQQYFIAANKEKTFLYYTLFFVVLAAILDGLVVLFKLSPIYIAFATLISFFLYGNTMNFLGYKEILGSRKEALKEIFKYLWPLGYALIGYGLLWLLAHFWLYNFINYYVVKIIQALLFTLWYSPILWKIEKESGILKIIWEGIKQKIYRG